MSSEIYLENNNNNNKLSTLLRELSGGVEPAGLSMTPPDVWDSERAMGMGSSSGSSGGAGGLGMFSTRDAGPPQRV